MGDLPWCMGEWPAYGDLPKRMGNASSVWPYGEAAKPMGRWPVCGKPRGCVGTADMEGAACVWEPPACMWNENPVKAGNMKVGCGMRTLRIFGNVGGGSWVWGIASSTEVASESAAAARL